MEEDRGKFLCNVALSMSAPRSKTTKNSIQPDIRHVEHAESVKMRRIGKEVMAKKVSGLSN